MCSYSFINVKSMSNDNFFERVYRIKLLTVRLLMALLPALGTARSARMVGWAMNASHGKDEVPAHRVVNRNGLLTGNSILTVQTYSNY
jgi:methylated-DNA-protein-cysteine methyltransferase-like protein